MSFITKRRVCAHVKLMSKEPARKSCP